jgi:hypothetical protein
MKKLAVTSLAALTLSLAAASGAQAIERLPIVKLAPPGATVVGNASPTVKRLPCSTCDYRPPVGRYPPGYTPPNKKKADLPPPAATSDGQPSVSRKPPSAVPPVRKPDSPPADVPAG